MGSSQTSAKNVYNLTEVRMSKELGPLTFGGQERPGPDGSSWTIRPSLEHTHTLNTHTTHTASLSLSPFLRPLAHNSILSLWPQTRKIVEGLV